MADKLQQYEITVKIVVSCAHVLPGEQHSPYDDPHKIAAAWAQMARNKSIGAESTTIVSVEKKNG